MKLNIANENKLNYLVLYPDNNYFDIIHIIEECEY